MMADFVTPRHSAVMERLRRRIELFRQHHNSCESRYESATLERLELERQQTFALHQRCLQAKAKRSNKHRQPQPAPAAAAAAGGGEQGGQRAGGGAAGGAAGGLESGEGGGTAAEQSRNSTLIALQETVKRKLESAGSPLGREQSNGYGDSCFPPSKKACLENGAANGSPLDSKLGLGEALGANGTHEANDGGARDLLDFHRKEMKQEPDDILPIMPPSGGGASSLFPDLNLNEQEWTELMEELNCSVPYEDIQDILNDGFEDRKDPLEQLAAPAAAGGGGAGAAALLPPDLVSVKSEFSPASVVAFEQQDSRPTGSSPHVRATPTGPAPHTPLPTSSPAAASSASSPAAAAAPAAGPPPPPRPLHLLPPKDLSPAQQLQQLAAQQQRAQQQQHLHSQLQHKQQQPAAGGAKFHSQGPHPHPHPHSAAWPPMAASSQSPLGGAFGLDKPSSPSLYPQDFATGGQKQLLMASKASPKAGGVGGVGPYLAGPPAPHHAMLAHPHPHPAQASAAMLNYSNTKPLSHFEAGPGGVGAGPGGLGAGPGPPTRAPGVQGPQKKAALLNLLRQQQVNQKNSSSSSMFRQQHLPHSQEQTSYAAPPAPPPHGAPIPANSLASAPGNSSNGLAPPQGVNAMTPGVNAMTPGHGASGGGATYLNSQMAAALKQQQQQQQQQYMQRQLMAEQEKQRQQQQDQQLQRQLTRPPPQYQDQPSNQSPFPPPSVSQFTASSSQPMGSVSSMGGSAPGAQRMFPQNQGMLGMSLAREGPPGSGSGVAPPPSGQADMSLSSCGGGGAGMEVQQVLYNNLGLHSSHPSHPRQQLGPIGAPYRHSLLQQQQHLKKQQQQLAAAARMQGAMGGGWQQQQQQQQQMANQPPPSSNAFSTGPAPFHLQQQQQSRLPKMPQGGGGPTFTTNRPMGGLNPGQQMMQGQQRAPPNPQQQQQQATNQSSVVLPDLVTFGQSNGRQTLQCNQGYQVGRSANQQQVQQQVQQQQQQVSFGYNVASGSFAGESELVDSLLKGQSAQEWMADLDELLASHP